jgi:hypothetical protein
MQQPILVDGRRIYDTTGFGRKLKFAAIRLRSTLKDVN